MATMIEQDTARLPIAVLVTAAHALSRAARWDDAFAVVDAAEPGSGPGRTALAIAAAHIALERDYVTGSSVATERIERTRQLVGEAPEAAGQWTVAYLQLRESYDRAIRNPDSSTRLGPDGRDPAELDALREQARRARDTAPDPVARGWAEMCLGWIADNLYGERDVAPPHYTAALQVGEANGDELLVREALRHLGDHDHDHGDHAKALDRWQRATAAGARAGTVPGTLSQQILIAVLARDAGDEAGARLLATEVARWAEAVGAVGIHAQATAFLDGVDPTAPQAVATTRATT
jgi:tetratricopeptide (TPR) repeat protein